MVHRTQNSTTFGKLCGKDAEIYTTPILIDTVDEVSLYVQNGIVVFESFRDWALAHRYEDGLTIDRIDVNKGYYPDNCRFCSMKSQANNRTSNIIVEFDGRSHTIKEWSEITGIPYSRLYMRIKKGWPVERAFEKS